MKVASAALAACITLLSNGVSATPMVLAYYSDYPNNYASLLKSASDLSAVSVDFYNIDANGVVTGNGAAAPDDAIAFLRSRKIPTYGCVSNVDQDWSPSIGHSVTTRNLDAAVANLVAFAKTNQFAGINIDFEALDQGDRNNFSNFVQVLGRALHAQGLKLIVSVPAFSSVDASNIHNYGYDLHALGANVDYLQLMTYDETIPGWDPGPVAGSDWMENDLDYASSEVAPGKLLSGLPAYGYDWQANDSGSQLFWTNTEALIHQYGVKPQYDKNSNSVTFTYTATDGSGLHTVWTENAKSIALKAGLVNAYGLGGVSMYALGMENSDFWRAVKSGLAQ